MFDLATHIDVNIIQKHPVADTAVLSVSEVGLLSVNVDRYSNLEHTFRQGSGDVNIARIVVSITIDV